jgi:hypothetical protein
MGSASLFAIGDERNRSQALTKEWRKAMGESALTGDAVARAVEPRRALGPRPSILCGRLLIASLAFAARSSAQGKGGTTGAVFTVSLSSASSLPVSVNCATVDRTALAGSDYAAVSGTLTFAPGGRF